MATRNMYSIMLPEGNQIDYSLDKLVIFNLCLRPFFITKDELKTNFTNYIDRKLFTPNRFRRFAIRLEHLMQLQISTE